MIQTANKVSWCVCKQIDGFNHIAVVQCYLDARIQCAVVAIAVDDIELLLRGLMAGDVEGVDASHYPSPDVAAACQQVEIKLVVESCYCGDDGDAVPPRNRCDVDWVFCAAE